jgi:C_GCAxxG_C_C family probable redox protein
MIAANVTGQVNGDAKEGQLKESRTREELLERAYQLGFEYEKKYRGCSQCALAAIYDTLKFSDNEVFKAATGFAGGGGLTGISVCGGYAAGVMAISQLCGRERSNFTDPQGIRFRTFEQVRDFTLDYIGELGSIICRDIQTRFFGRPYYIADPDDFAKFEAAGGHDDKCTEVVGRATRLAVKFILDHELLSPPASKPLPD